MRFFRLSGLLLACVVQAGFALPASASHAVWQGTLFVTTANAACKNGGIEAGGWSTYFTGLYAPAGVGDNGANTKLAIHSPRSALHYEWASSAMTTGTVPGTMMSSATVSMFSAPGTFSIAKSAPLAPTTATQTVVLTVRILDFSGNAGCLVTLQGSLGLRPNNPF